MAHFGYQGTVAKAAGRDCFPREVSDCISIDIVTAVNSSFLYYIDIE